MAIFFGVLTQGFLGWALLYVMEHDPEDLLPFYAIACLASLIGFSIAKRSALWGFLFGLLFCIFAVITILIQAAEQYWSSWETEEMVYTGIISGSIECAIGAIVGGIAGKRSRRRNEVLTNEPSSEGAIEEASDIKIRIGDEQTPIGTMSRETTSSAICPVCQSGFMSEQQTITCPKCRVKHHKECWDMIGGCSTFGCKRS